MKSIVESAFDVRSQSENLGFTLPDDHLIFLPRNFENAQSNDLLLYENELPTIRSLLRQAGIEATRVDLSTREALAAEKHLGDYIIPSVFVSLALWQGNPHVISVALNIISTYLTDTLKGARADRNVSLSVLIETAEHITKKIEYSGPVDGLNSVKDIIRELQDNGQRAKS